MAAVRGIEKAKAYNTFYRCRPNQIKSFTQQIPKFNLRSLSMQSGHVYFFTSFDGVSKIKTISAKGIII